MYLLSISLDIILLLITNNNRSIKTMRDIGILRVIYILLSLIRIECIISIPPT